MNHISSGMYIGLNVNYLLFLSDFDRFWIFSTDLQNTQNKFHKNQSSGRKVISNWHTNGRTNRQA